jgi:bacillithiol biosynthesis cysteine-adding enzyme BshC
LNSHCFPFRQIPHTTQLFLDYLDRAPGVHQFYPRSARFLEWAKDESSRVQYPADRRSRVADILERQNKAFGASARTLENISALRSGAFALVTGQQVGLFGGPAFSLYKALSAIKLASEAQKLGIACVPVFWLATEDHDLEEVNHTSIPTAEAELEPLATSSHSVENAPVGSIPFSSDISELVSRVDALLDGSEAGTWIRECYRSGESFGNAFAKFFARVFAEHGVVLLDGADAELDHICAPVYQELIQRSRELSPALLQRDQELQRAGYHQQVRITETSIPLFMIRNGSRVPLRWHAPESFMAGEERFSERELLELVQSSPEVFSPNVLSRPVVQDYLLPTLAYVGGAAEVAYFAQAGVLYERVHGRVTPILSRFSATLIEAKPQAVLEKYRLQFSDLFHGPESLREKIGAQLLDSSLQSSFDQAAAAVERSMGAVRGALEQLDKTLVDSADNAKSKMLYQLTNLRSRAARAELRQTEIADRHARILSNSLYPNKTLQEREFAAIYFLAKHGNDLLSGLLDAIHPDCLDHQLISL